MRKFSKEDVEHRQRVRQNRWRKQQQKNFSRLWSSYRRLSLRVGIFVADTKCSSKSIVRLIEAVK